MDDYFVLFYFLRNLHDFLVREPTFSFGNRVTLGGKNPRKKKNGF